MGIAINPYQTTSIMERERFFSWLNLFHIQMSHTNSGQPHPSILKTPLKGEKKYAAFQTCAEIDSSLCQRVVGWKSLDADCMIKSNHYPFPSGQREPSFQ